jgi:hypothetical protein
MTAPNMTMAMSSPIGQSFSIDEISHPEMVKNRMMSATNSRSMSSLFAGPHPYLLSAA